MSYDGWVAWRRGGFIELANVAACYFKVRFLVSYCSLVLLVSITCFFKKFCWFSVGPVEIITFQSKSWKSSDTVIAIAAAMQPRTATWRMHIV